LAIEYSVVQLASTVLPELRTWSKKLAFSRGKPLSRVRSGGNWDPKRSQVGAQVGKPFISSLVVFCVLTEPSWLKSALQQWQCNTPVIIRFMCSQAQHFQQEE
jgi:hypothetical protein